MPGKRTNLIALFTAFLLMVLGSSFQSTLLAIRAGVEGFSQSMTGVMMASFFFGYAGGSVLTAGFLRSVGYVRTFAALASIASAITLLHGIFAAPSVWVMLRFAFGICYSGMVLIVESWLNAESDSRQRGKVLAVYGILFMVASGAAQFGVLLGRTSGLILFAAVSVIISLSLVPTNLMPIAEPATPTYHKLTLSRLYAVSPFGIVGVVSAGLVTGGFWTLGPRFVQDIGLGEGSVALFMSSAILGGATFQWPLGILSDRIDRRLVILTSFSFTALFGGLILLVGVPAGGNYLYIGAFGFGAFGLPLYSLCLAHVNDHLRWDELVPAASTVVILFGVSSGAGPALAGFAMELLGPGGLYGLATGVALLFVVYGITRLGTRAPLVAPRKRVFQHLPRTTQGAARFLRRRTHEEAPPTKTHR